MRHYVPGFMQVTSENKMAFPKALQFLWAKGYQNNNFLQNGTGIGLDTQKMQCIIMGDLLLKKCMWQ